MGALSSLEAQGEDKHGDPLITPSAFYAHPSPLIENWGRAGFEGLLLVDCVSRRRKKNKYTRCVFMLCSYPHYD